MEFIDWSPGFSLCVKSQHPREYGYKHENMIDGEMQTTAIKIEDGGWCFYDSETDEEVGIYEFATRVLSVKK